MAGDYDKILRENFGKVVLSSSERFFGFKVREIRDLPGKVHQTLEREPDFLKVITPYIGDEFILHLEYQVKNDPNMLRRMRTYHAMLEEVHRLPVRQFVLYLGRSRPTMRTRFRPEEVMTGFELVNVHQLDARSFLDSNIPEEIILAVLADFRGQDAEVFMRLILQRLRTVGEDGIAIQKAVQQLGILSRIPKLVRTYIEAVKTMPLTLDINKDILFIEGREKGIQEGREKEREVASRNTALRMLRAQKYSLEEISAISELSIEEIKALKKELGMD